jgi:hypothetical protein
MVTPADDAVKNSLDVNKLTLAERRAIVEEFRDALKVGVPDDMRIVFAQSPDAFGPGSKYVVNPLNDAALAKLREDENLYYCVAAVTKYTYGDTGHTGWRRTQESVGAGILVGFDDIGTKTVKKCGKGLDFFEETLRPTAVIETSPGNFQCLYFLAAPILDSHEYGDVLRSIIKPLSDRYGIDKLADINRVLRLPFGINNKTLEDGSLKYPEGDGAWRVRLVYADYAVRYTPQEIAEAYGVEIVRTPRKAEIERRVAGRDEDPYKAAGFDLLADAYTKAGRAWPSRTEAGRKYRICCPFEGEHASGGMNDDAMIADPAASKNGYFTFHCSHGSCNSDSEAYAEGRRTFAAAMTAAGISADAWLVAEKAERKEMEAIERRLRRVNLVDWVNGLTWDEWVRAVEADATGLDAVESEHSDDEAVPASDSKSGDAVSEKKPNASKGAGEAAGAAARKTQWSEGWYYITSNDRMVRPGERDTYSRQGFNALHAINLPDVKSVFDYVAKKIGFTRVYGVAYAAGLPLVYSHEGRRFVNEYLEASVPRAATEFTEKGRAAIVTFEGHVKLICSGDGDLAHKLISWMALNVQKPGEIIGCAPLIKGIQGDGKTIIFMEAMKAVMGAENVGEVSAKELNSDFNSYAYGRALRVFEELKAAGMNRVANENSMRTLITNRSVRVVGKNKDGVDVPNRTNYVGLTNHEDALPLKDTDRRWWVIFTPWKHISELTEAVGGDLEAYMEKLANACRDNATELRKYLLEYKLHTEIKHNMRAPDTIWKKAMIAAEQHNNGGDLFDTFVEGDEIGVSSKVISTDHLTRLYKAYSSDPRSIPKTRQMTELLLSRGWIRVGEDSEKIKWLGWPRTIYVKDGNILKMGDLRNGEVNRLLNETLPVEWREGPDGEKAAKEKEKGLRASGKARHDF